MKKFTTTLKSVCQNASMSNCQRLTVGSPFDGLLEKGFILLAYHHE